MKKKLLTLALVLAIILSISALPAFAAASNLSANPTASTVYVNGAATAFEAYNIGGNNYFKLRDLAYALNGTAKQFEVGYDNATKAITLTTGRAYTPDGGEMARGDGRAKTASPTASSIYLDGSELSLTVYLIGGNNFFKLRDLMEAIDVFVGYDNATKAITLDTSKGYVPEGSATPTPTPTPATTSGGITGVWVIGSPINPIEKAVRWMEFKSDGTFTAYWDYNPNVYSNSDDWIMGGMWWDYINTPGVHTFKGNYSVSGKSINLTNITNSFRAGAGSVHTVIAINPVDDYTDKPTDDMVWSYELWAGGEKHDVLDSYTEYDSLQLSGWIRDVDSYYHPRTPNGVELWPQALPDSIYPTGINGIAQADQNWSIPDILDMYDIAAAFGVDDSSRITFYINTSDPALASFQSFKTKLLSNGFADNSIAGMWIFERNIEINGITYGLEISLLETGAYGVTIKYDFRTYALY